MRDLNKMTKAELLNEAKALRQRVSELETEQVEFDQMDAEFRESEERFRLLTETAPVGILLHKDEEIFYANSTATKLLGASDPKELIGKNILSDLIHPDFRQVVLDRAQSVREQNLVVPLMEEKYLRLDGTTVDVEVAATPFVAQGKRMFQVIINDISERKKTQELIRLRLSLMEYAAEHSLDELLQKTLDEIEALTNSCISFFHFVEPDQQTLSLQTWSTRTLSEFCEAEGKGYHYPIDEAGIWADCVRERRAIIHNDYQSLPHRKGLPEGHAQVIRELVVPIIKGDRIMAILGVGNKPQDYVERDVELISYLADVAWEITERKRADEALQESEEKFRSIVENALVGIFTVDNAYHFIYANDELCKILGYFDEQLLGMDFREVLSDASRDMVAERYVQRQRGEEVPSRYEMSIVRADGEIRDVEMSVTVIRDKNGSLLTMGQLVDITDRKQAEEALKAKTEELDRFFTVALDLLCIADTDGYFRRLNPQWEKVLGYSLQELEGHHFLDLVHPDDQTNTLAALDELGNQEAVLNFINRYRCKDGSYRWIEWRSHPLGNLVYAAARDITERKQTEESLRLTRFTVDSVADAVYWIDPQARIVDVNEAACRMLGYTRDEMTEMSLTEIDPDFSLTRWPNTWKNIKKAGKLTLESQHCTKDGQLIPVEVIANYIEFGGRELDCAVVRDITERKKAEEVLQMFEYSNDQASVSIFWMNRDAEYFYVNNEACRSLGYTREELLGMRLWDIDPIYPKERWYSNLEEYQDNRQGGSEHVESFHCCKDGVIFPVEVFSRHLWLGENEFHVAFVQDITERRQVEEALRASEEKYRSLFEASPESITLIGLDGAILDCNEATAVIAGMPRSELIGKLFLDMRFLDEADRPSIMERFARVVSGELYEPFQLKVIPRDNKVLWLEIYLASLKRDNEVYAIQVIARDITDQKQIEIERENLIQKLETQNAELERFTYTVSHDLKSPLITIGGFLGFLEEDAMKGNTDKLKEDIQRINNATSKMDSLLDELLELSRIGRMMNPPEDIPFEEIVREALERLEGQLNDGKVQVEVSNNLPVIHGDRTRLVEVVQNLVDNGIKFMGNQPKPKVEIGTKKEYGEDIFFVHDNGIGIDPKYHEIIFGLFNKLDQYVTGTGIGLALVKRIIEVHGGRIWVESKIGEGSTFYFTLPKQLVMM